MSADEGGCLIQLPWQSCQSWLIWNVGQKNITMVLKQVNMFGVDSSNTFWQEVKKLGSFTPIEFSLDLLTTAGDDMSTKIVGASSCVHPV